MSEAKQAICEWCGCAAWWPLNKLMTVCDCNRTAVMIRNPGKPLSAPARELMERVASRTPEQNAQGLRRLITALHEPIEEDFKNMPIEEVDAYLRAEGIDPEALQQKLAVRLAEIRAKLDATEAPQ